MNSNLLMIHSACTVQAGVATPLGSLRLARTPRGLAGAWFDGQRHHPGVLSARDDAADPLLRDAAAQLQAYFAGERLRFDLPLDLLGTPFQCDVWQALLGIACGETVRYGDVAARIGAPSAARAVGAAIGRNPLSIFVPCHRVLGTGCALTGYAGGLDRKVALLDLEHGRQLPPVDPRRSVCASASRRGPHTSAAATPQPPVAA
jgi:methylated-DNA-[protein]-cysteine S-methyltransferase